MTLVRPKTAYGAADYSNGLELSRLLMPSSTFVFTSKSYAAYKAAGRDATRLRLNSAKIAEYVSQARREHASVAVDMEHLPLRTDSYTRAQIEASVEKQAAVVGEFRRQSPELRVGLWLGQLGEHDLSYVEVFNHGGVIPVDQRRIDQLNTWIASQVDALKPLLGLLDFVVTWSYFAYPTHTPEMCGALVAGNARPWMNEIQTIAAVSPRYQNRAIPQHDGKTVDLGQWYAGVDAAHAMGVSAALWDSNGTTGNDVKLHSSYLIGKYR